MHYAAMAKLYGSTLFEQKLYYYSIIAVAYWVYTELVTLADVMPDLPVVEVSATEVVTVVIVAMHDILIL